MRRSALALLALLAACGPSYDPATAPRAVSPLGLEPPPIYSLLGYRQEIGLSSEQITALDSIAEAVRRENAPLVQELRERSPARAQQQGLVVVDSAGQTTLQQLRDNNQRAIAAVGEVLTPEQRTTACRLFDQARRDRMGRRGESDRRTAAERRRMTQMGDTLWTRARSGWSWCGPAAGGPAAEPGR